MGTDKKQAPKNAAKDFEADREEVEEGSEEVHKYEL